MNILIDTREQQPLLFENYSDIKWCRDTLACGDYTVAGHDLPTDDHSVIFERKKNCLELVSNLGMNWERFQSELKLMTQYKHKQIVVCAPNNFQYIFDKRYTKINPEFAYKRIAHIFTEYHIPIVFMDTRQEAETYMYRVLVDIYRRGYSH